MLLRIFKTSQPLSWILITFIILIVRIALFGVLYNFLDYNFSIENNLFGLENLTIWSPWLSHILATLIILLSGFFLNAIGQNINLFKGIHYLLFLFFGLLSSFNPENLILSPFIITIPLVLFATKIILTPSKEKVSLGSVFNAAFIVGVTSLFYFPSAIYLIMIWLSLTYLNQINWRQFIVSIIGAYLPWLFHDVIIFSFNLEIQTLGQIVNSVLQGFTFTNYSPYKATSLILILIIFQLVNYLKIANSSIIKIRKTYLILFMFLIIGTTITGFLNVINPQLMNLIIIPSSVVFTAFHLDVKKWWVSDLFFITLICSLVLSYMNL